MKKNVDKKGQIESGGEIEGVFIFIELVRLPKRLLALRVQIVDEVETDFHRSVKFRIHTLTMERKNLIWLVFYILTACREI